MIKPHTCSEWNPATNEVCGKPAPFQLKIEDLETKTITKNWKCSVHIRRYHHIGRAGKIRATITAYKDKIDAKPRNSRTPSPLGQRTRRRK